MKVCFLLGTLVPNVQTEGCSTSLTVAAHKTLVIGTVLMIRNIKTCITSGLCNYLRQLCCVATNLATKQRVGTDVGVRTSIMQICHRLKSI